MTRFQFVADHQHAYEVKRLCALLDVERSSYHAWHKTEPDRQARADDDAALAELITTIHDKDKTMGAPRITAELNDPTSAYRPQFTSLVAFGCGPVGY